MKKLIPGLFLSLLSLSIYAQSFNVKGRLIDNTGQGLPSATILLLNARDSVMTNYALTSQDGNFEIRNIRRGDYLLRASYVGFSTITLPVVAPEGNLLDMGAITLSSSATMLREITVQEERIPMRVRNDTIEYDALAFRPLPNEMVEDLLRRMPGMVISSDGTVEAQGEIVRRVLVDGKEFFGRDPKMATQNIAAESVSRIQVFDQRSEQSLFTGIDDGFRERTINLELREDRKEATFGNASMGYGPDDRFQGRANLNRFDKKGQISVLGMGNNVNQQGFSVGDALNFSGATQSIARGGGANIGRGNVPINFDGSASSNGLITSWAGGLNFNRTLAAGTELTTSYFYNQLDQNMIETTDRENYLPGGSYDFNQIQRRENQNYNHRLNMRVDHKFSERSSLLFTGSSALTKNNSFGFTDSKTFGLNGTLQNSGAQTTDTDALRFDVNTSLLYRQRLNKPGRTLTAGFDFSRANNNRDAILDALNSFYQQTLFEDRILQDQNRRDWNSNISGSLTVTEPLAAKLFLEGNYNVSYAMDEVNLKIFDKEVPGSDGVFNDMLSNHYENVYLYHRMGVNLRLNQTKYNITLGNAFQLSDLNGYSFSLQQDVKRNYQHYLPSARFNYDFNTFRRFSADYETSVREPSSTQIQPVIDNRDPLNIYAGNPDLLPSFRHRWQMRFNSFNPGTSRGFFVNFTADYTTNAITNSVSVDEFLVRTTSPVNVDNNVNLRGSFNYNFGIEKLKSRIMFGTSVNRSESVNVLNNTNQEIVNNTLTPNLRYIFRPVDDFELRLSANFNNQITRYEFSSTEQAFLNQTYQADLNWTFLKHYRLQGIYNYSIFQGRTSDFDRKVPMLDVNIARSFLKNNSGELRLSVFNLLDTELGVTQTTNANYYERAVTNSLGRYVMLTFTYNLNRQLNMMDGAGRGRGRGGMMMMH